MEIWSSKTTSRSTRFVIQSLMWRGHERPYALMAWAGVAGFAWLLADTAVSFPFGLLSAPGKIFLLFLLVAICAVDARFGIIPDSLVIGLGVFGVAQLVIVWLMKTDIELRMSFLGTFSELGLELLQRAIEVCIVFFTSATLRGFYRRARGRDGLGFGDVKLVTAGAIWIGLSSIPLMMCVAVASALLSLAILRHDGARFHREDAIAFGPHLAIGIWLAAVAPRIG